MFKTTLSLLLLISASLLSWSTLAAEDSCAADKIDLWTKATYATNGSNLIIQGKRVRLNGLYAPQIERKQKFHTPGEPLAKESQTFFNKLLANNDLEVGVEYDKTKVDEFGRQLVHLFLRDGTNVQQKILESGFAVTRIENGNIKHMKCYFDAEKKARKGGFQLWDYLAKHPESHFPLAKSSELTSQDEGFRIIQGKVLKVEKSSTNYIINMDTTGIRVPKRYWDFFDYSQIKKLKGQTIEVRGQAYLYQGVMFMIIDHPYSIDKLNPAT
ncbi:thermonuclease family protein [Thiomicrorhabdus arctica]|jgi:endonuclease YncB( thermonuclease family)|uniref:thermonuclease family protein n=1 Tax=Thiomicrorhabdus arctica TaxID=131540 RepID=UPI00036C629B|nr:thermonuclease family protein [Thiomicrorhabdus arctica]